MCGLVALRGSVPIPVLAMAIAGAGARGPHSHGWALQNGDGWTVLRYPGRLIYATLPSKYASHIKDGFVGHSRLATSGSRAGDAPPISEAQPYVAAGRYLIAHNGTAPNASVRPGEVDTKALLRELEAGSAPVDLLARSGTPQAVVWAVAGAVYAVRVNGERQPAHPLYLARGRDWYALSSGPIPRGKMLAADKVISLDI